MYVAVVLCMHAEFEEKLKTGRLSAVDLVMIECRYSDPKVGFFVMLADVLHSEAIVPAPSPTTCRRSSRSPVRETGRPAAGNHHAAGVVAQAPQYRQHLSSRADQSAGSGRQVGQDRVAGGYRQRTKPSEPMAMHWLLVTAVGREARRRRGEDLVEQVEPAGSDSPMAATVISQPSSALSQPVTPSGAARQPISSTSRMNPSWIACEKNTPVS